MRKRYDNMAKCSWKIMKVANAVQIQLLKPLIVVKRLENILINTKVDT